MLGERLRRIGEAFREDFRDAGDVALWVHMGMRLAFAAVLGGSLGWQREWTGKPAGLRTHMLVALGAAFVLIAAQQSGAGNDQVSRVIQGIVTGVGFVGGGAILKRSERREVHGLTTATSIWLAGMVGIAAGLGREVLAIFGTLLALLVLSALLRLEIQIRSWRGRRTPGAGDGDRPHQDD